MLKASAYQPYVWFRYIDDIFFIWLNNQESLDEFKLHVNSFHPTIKFTLDQTRNEIPFLDLWIQLRGNKITTRTYHKPTDAHNYLHYKSNHPQHQKKGIPYSQQSGQSQHWADQTKPTLGQHPANQATALIQAQS